jgi:prepilin-type N-terminal cleavage/methylation domain-containing protein
LKTERVTLEAFPKSAGFRNGFTLLELLVVLILVTLISVLAGPRIMTSLTRLELRNSAKQISASLRFARSQAASHKTLYLSVFDFENNRILIFPHETPVVESSIKDIIDDRIEKKQDIGMVSLTESIRLEKAFTANDEEVSSEYFVVFFYSRGNSSGGEIVLVDEKERRFKIVVDPITGSVSVAEVEDA